MVTDPRPDSPVSPDPEATPEPSDPGHPVDPPERPTARRSAPKDLRHTKAGATWVAVVVFVLVTIAFVVFVAQNSESVTVSFLGFEGDLSLAAALLIAAIAGALLVAIPAGVRILQLRRAVPHP